MTVSTVVESWVGFKGATQSTPLVGSAAHHFAPILRVRIRGDMGRLVRIRGRESSDLITTRKALSTYYLTVLLIDDRVMRILKSLEATKPSLKVVSIWL